MTDPIGAGDPGGARPTGWLGVSLGAAAGVGEACAMPDEG